LVKRTMINTMTRDKFDDLYTPRSAVIPILEILPKDKIVWECCDDGGSDISTVLRENGYTVISTDIKTGFDFLKDTPDFEFDMIVTNPPYSLKTKFLEKCYSYDKPFALLLPLTTLEGIARGNLFRKYGINVLVLDSRVGYIKEKHSPWFNSSWFFWKFFKYEDNLMFYSMEEENVIW